MCVCTAYQSQMLVKALPKNSGKRDVRGGMQSFCIQEKAKKVAGGGRFFFAFIDSERFISNFFFFF